jgi:hypothetical protein
VSILIGAGVGVGRYLGSHPRANTSMTIMRPPQRGHGQGSTRGSSAPGAFSSSGSTMRGAAPSSSRARAMLSARLVLASRPPAFARAGCVADAVEALRQHVDQEAADELVRRERHRLPALGAFDAVVLPAERDAAVVGRHQPAIGDRHAVRVARQIA